MNYEQALTYISGYTDYEKVPMPHALASYDLRRVEELLARLGNPHLKTRSVHIAGTNGKGSTAAMIASVLTKSGYRTGLYTSPHLNTIRERFRINGKLISTTEFTAIVARLKPEVERVNELSTYGELTTFELLTALCFTYFSRHKVDFQVLEVGMGGRFDATNVIQPEVCVITSISLDHTQVLGNSVTEIATEKAGIIKPGSTVVLSPQKEAVTRVVEEACQRQGAELVMVGRDITWRSLGFDSRQQLLEVSGWQNKSGARSRYRISIPFLGRYQLENAATAVAALEVLIARGADIPQDSIIEGLRRVSWPGRLQVLARRPLLVVDGAHNPDAARKLREALSEYFSFKKAIFIMGASRDKDISGVVSALNTLFGEVIVTQSRHPRAMEPARLASIFGQYGIEAKVAATVPEAISIAMGRAGTHDLICVTGSLFVVAEAIEWMTKSRNRETPPLDGDISPNILPR
jgi:dihydrofolate synthase/folylpolyglutamate synthase